MQYARLICLLFALPAWLSSAQAQTSSYVVDAAKSAAWFEVNYFGNAVVKGKLAVLQGQVTFDANDRQGSGQIDFDMNSVQTGRDFINNFVKSEKIFDTKKFPLMRFSPQQFEFQDEHLIASEGELTLHGVSRNVRLQVKHFSCQDSVSALLFDVSTPIVENLPMQAGKNACYGEFRTSISRSQFGMDSLSFMVSDQVNITANLLLLKVQP